MKKSGTVVRWNDEKGFGFIRSPQSTADVFVHVRDCRGLVPGPGMNVTFEEIHVGGKGSRAMAVRPAAMAPVAARDAARPSAPRKEQRVTPVQRHRREGDRSGLLALPLMLGYAALLVGAVIARELPWWLLPASAALNLLAFYAYWVDKHAATQRQWRTAEQTLHLWGLAGGWVGGWFAQQILRHKNRKSSFLAAYWLTVLVHCACVAGWLWIRKLP